MYEYIFPGLALDEAKAFAGVEPLYCSLFFAHFVILFSLKSYLMPREPELEFLSRGEGTEGSGRLQLLFCDPVLAQGWQVQILKPRIPVCGHKKRPRV